MKEAASTTVTTECHALPCTIETNPEETCFRGRGMPSTNMNSNGLESASSTVPSLRLSSYWRTLRCPHKPTRQYFKRNMIVIQYLVLALLFRTSLAWTSQTGFPSQRSRSSLSISSGFSFSDGNQVLVSVQKPLGLVLEQDEDCGASASGNNIPIQVVEVVESGSAARAGVRVGDTLVAVQNADMGGRTLEEALSRIGQAPAVVNLRFIRQEDF